MAGGTPIGLEEIEETPPPPAPTKAQIYLSETNGKVFLQKTDGAVIPLEWSMFQLRYVESLKTLLLPSRYSMVVSDDFEIELGGTLELDEGAILEVL